MDNFFYKKAVDFIYSLFCAQLELELFAEKK